MSGPPARLITSLSGEYKVFAMSWLTDAQCLAVAQALEQEGQVPFRSIGGPGVQLALGGDTVKIAGWEYDVLVFGRTIGIVWQKCPAAIEMERIVEVERRRRGYQEKGWPLCFYPDEYLTPEERTGLAKSRRLLKERLEVQRAVKEAEAIARRESP